MESQGINLNITGRDEYIPKIERFIRTIKERTRVIVTHYLLTYYQTD